MNHYLIRVTNETLGGHKAVHVHAPNDAVANHEAMALASRVMDWNDWTQTLTTRIVKAEPSALDELDREPGNVGMWARDVFVAYWLGFATSLIIGGGILGFVHIMSRVAA